MKRRTHLYTDEQTFWHCTGVQASHMQVGERWPGKIEQCDKWIFCLRAAMSAA